jgi:hypothetical protein
VHFICWYCQLPFPEAIATHELEGDAPGVTVRGEKVGEWGQVDALAAVSVDIWEFGLTRSDLLIGPVVSWGRNNFPDEAPEFVVGANEGSHKASFPTCVLWVNAVAQLAFGLELIGINVLWIWTSVGVCCNSVCWEFEDDKVVRMAEDQGFLVLGLLLTDGSSFVGSKLIVGQSCLVQMDPMSFRSDEGTDAAVC